MKSKLKFTLHDKLPSYLMVNMRNSTYWTTVLAILLIVHSWHQHEILAARILALLVTPSRSHHIWNRSLMLALASRGHQVTVVSPDPEKQPIPNYRDIVIDGVYEQVTSAFDYEAMSEENHWQNVISVFDWGLYTCRKCLASSGARQLMEMAANETYDLIITETVLDECFLGFIPKFGTPPVIGLTAYACPPWAGYLTANPDNPSYVNTFNLPYSDHMNFLQRMVNMLMHSYVLLCRTLYHMPNMQNLANEFFGKPFPTLSEIERNISLILVNIHHSFDYPRPMVPGLIPVGGMHIKPAKPLPKDIKKFLDEAKDGAIFFSLGSNLRSDKMTASKRQALLEAFAELPQKVLWKWESESSPDLPKNVKVGKWLPQNDILGHPNIHLFITHSGLLSTQEAIYHGVPVLGVPFLADQYVNIQKCINYGVGESLDYRSLTKQGILEKIQKVLSPSYRKNMKTLSEKFRDRPETPLDTAVYWTEYVIRHGGAHHLQSAALNLTWYQYMLLDIVVVLVAVPLILLAFCIKIFKVIWSHEKMNRNTKTKKH